MFGIDPAILLVILVLIAGLQLMPTSSLSGAGEGLLFLLIAIIAIGLTVLLLTS